MNEEIGNFLILWIRCIQIYFREGFYASFHQTDKIGQNIQEFLNQTNYITSSFQFHQNILLFNQFYIEKKSKFSMSYEHSESIQDEETGRIFIKKSLKPKLIIELNKKCEEKYIKKLMFKPQEFNSNKQLSQHKQILTIMNDQTHFNKKNQPSNGKISITKRKDQNRSKMKFNPKTVEIIEESSIKKVYEKKQLLLVNQASNRFIFCYIREIYINGTTNINKLTFNNAYVYEGELQNNKFDGLGTLIFPNGKTIRAIWQKKQIGYSPSKITYPSGQIYIGQIALYRKHGFGYLFLADGSQYVGQFFQGNINAEEKKYLKKNLHFGQGIWQKGILICQTRVILQKDEYFKFIK